MLLKQRVVVDSAVLFSSVLGADTMRGCARHAGVWTAPPVHTPTQTQVSMVDGPLAGNGLLGLTTAPHSESWPPSPPNETHFGKQTLWIGSNSFWSANTYGADGAGAAWVPPSSGPFPHCEVPYSMLGVGGQTVEFLGAAPGTSGRYSAHQDLCNGVISSNVTGTAGEIFSLATFASADDNVVATNITCIGCMDATDLTIDLWVHRGRQHEPFDQATCGADNMPRGAFILPTSASVRQDNHTAVVTRSSAIDGVNSAVLTTCNQPYVNDASQNISITASRHVTLQDGRCIVRAGPSTAAGANGDKTTIGACVGPNSTWVHAPNGNLVSGFDSGCMTRVAGGGPYLTVLPCTTNSTRWKFAPSSAVPTSGMLVAEVGSDAASDSRMCFTAVEQSFVADVAMAACPMEQQPPLPKTRCCRRC